jgi:hypothetical protein
MLVVAFSTFVYSAPNDGVEGLTEEQALNEGIICPDMQRADLTHWRKNISTHSRYNQELAA